jgi:glycosyltransferase 2 family protein
VIAKLTGSLWVRGVLTVGVLALLATRIDLGASAGAILRLDVGTIALVLALLAMDRGVMIWRWFSLLRAVGTRITIRSAAWIYLVSSFAGSYTAVAGDAARALTLSRRDTAGSTAVASVAVDRLLGLLSILFVGVIGAIVGGRRRGEHDAALVAMTVLVAGGAVVLLTADRWVRAALPGSWSVTTAGGRLVRLADALARYRGHGTTLTAVSVLSVAVQILRILQAYLLGRGIGIDVELSYYLLFMPVGLIALMLPISIGGFGAPQGLIVWLLKPRGVPEADAFALATLIVLSGIVANLPGALLLLRRRPPPPE